MIIMVMEACKHLDYEGYYIDCEIVEIEGFSCPVKHWKRNNPPYSGAPVNVQFCKDRGRVNEIFACYNPGEMHCYEPALKTSLTRDNGEDK